MGICSKCGGPTTFKQGVSQKTGKPYSGTKCEQCGDFVFNRVVAAPQQQRPQAPQFPQQAPQQSVKLELLKLAVQLACADKGAVVELYEQLQSVYSGGHAIPRVQQPQVNEDPFWSGVPETNDEGGLGL